MIVGVRGTLERRGADTALIAVGGVVLQVIATRRALDSLGEPGSAVALSTYLHLREDAIALYGFVDDAEKELFQKLIGVGGVGPRLAVALLSALEPERLALAVEAEDVALLGRVPGIGKRLASRIVLELKGKLPALGAGGPTAVRGRGDGPLEAALAGMGFTLEEIQGALAALPADARTDTPEAIAAALHASLQHLSERSGARGR